MSGRVASIRLMEGDSTRLNDVGRIMQAAFDPRYGEAWTPSQVSGILALPGVWLTLAALDDEPAGFALTRMILDEAELLLLAVDPSLRGRGVGSALLRSVIVRAKDRAVARLHLEVRANNPAIQLYRQFGFVHTGVRSSYYRGSNGQLYDAFSFSLNLLQNWNNDRD